MALGALALLCCAGLADVAQAKGPEYKLLRLDGSVLKWGSPELGSGARVTYAIATRRTAFRGARNCKAITSPKALVRRSGIGWRLFTSEVRAAFDAWQRIANISFQAVADPRRADIVIGAQVNPRGYAYTNVDFAANADAVAPLRKSVVCLNPLRRWKAGFDGDEDIYDIRYTLIHEIGHAIGLDHADHGQIMDHRYTELFRQPQSGDAVGLTRLYGALPASRTAGGATAPEPADNAPAADRSRAWPQLGLGRP